MFTTSQDFFKTATDTFASLPKTSDEYQKVLAKTKNVFESEVKNSKEVIETYTKAAKGDASINEISTANKKAQELLVAARFACIMSIPGSIFMLPALTKLADEYSFDLIPKSVKKEFNL